MSEAPPPTPPAAAVLEIGERLVEAPSNDLITVSYTHLTLPTILRV